MCIHSLTCYQFATYYTSNTDADAPCYFCVFNNYLKAKQALQKKKQQLQLLAPIKMSKLLCKKPNIKPVKWLVH